MQVDWELGGKDVQFTEPDSGYPAQVAFNYNMLEGRFKQLQGKWMMETVGSFCL